MLSTVTKRALILALIALCTAASAGDKPPRVLQEPVLGLRLDARVKLDPLPEEVRALCVQTADNNSRTSRLWIFARASDAGAVFYVVSGYVKLLHPAPGEPAYDLDDQGGFLTITGSKCEADPAHGAFEARAFDEIPQSIYRQLSRDLAARLVRAVGGADKLRTEIKNQRIDFDSLSPELQEAFKPYFPAAK